MLKALELKVPPPVVWLVCATGIWALQRWLPVPELWFPGRSWLALVLFLAGVAIAARGVMIFRRHATTVHPTHPERTSTVVTEDIFSLSRNPMYLGLTLALLAWATQLGSVAGAILLVPCFVIYLTELQIKPEERTLSAKFGADYAAYLETVRRWI